MGFELNLTESGILEKLMKVDERLKAFSYAVVHDNLAYYSSEFSNDPSMASGQSVYGIITGYQQNYNSSDSAFQDLINSSTFVGHGSDGLNKPGGDLTWDNYSFVDPSGATQNFTVFYNSLTPTNVTVSGTVPGGPEQSDHFNNPDGSYSADLDGNPLVDGQAVSYLEGKAISGEAVSSSTAQAAFLIGTETEKISLLAQNLPKVQQALNEAKNKLASSMV